MGKKDFKKKIKSNTLKQAGMAGAIVATVVPTVAALVVADENDFKKSNNTVSFATATKANSTTTQQAAQAGSYATSAIPVPKRNLQYTNINDDPNFMMRWLASPAIRSTDWGSKLVTETNDFVLNKINATQSQEGINDNLAKIELVGQAQGSSTKFTLNLSSGLQAPTMTDSFMDKLANTYNSVKNAHVDKQQLKNAFKAYYVVEGDTQWHLLADANGNQASGTNTFPIGDIAKFMTKDPATNETKLPSIDLAWFFNFDQSLKGVASDAYSTIPDALKTQLQGLGGTHRIEGGKSPSTLFKTMTDYSTFYSDSAIKLPEFLSGGTSKNPATKFNDYLKGLLSNFVSGITYSGTTATTVVNFSSTLDLVNNAEIKKFFEDKQGEYDVFHLGHNKAGAKQLYQSLYYSIGEEISLHKVNTTLQSFTIHNWNSKLKNANGKGPYLNDIHYYIALDSSENGGERIPAWDSQNNKWDFCKTVGVRQDVTSYDAQTGATKNQFRTIQDVVSFLEVPKPIDDTKSSRTVEEKPQLGLINNYDANGNFHRNENVVYKYRIVGTNSWFLKDDFFKPGKPGSTPEALSVGTEWQATTTAQWDDALTKNPPTGSKWNDSEKSFVGQVGWDLPLISQIDAPTFKVDDSTKYSITLPANNVGIAYKFRLVNPDNPTQTLKWPTKSTNGEYLTFQEFKSINQAGLPNIFNQATGKFWAIEWIGAALNSQSPKKEEKGIFHATNDDLPKSTVKAIIRDNENGSNVDPNTPIANDAQPSIDYHNTTDSKNIIIKLPDNNIFNYKFGFDNQPFNLTLNSNGLLVDQQGQKVNALDGTSLRNIKWTLDTQRVKDPAVADFTSQHGDFIGTLYPIGLTKYIDQIPTMPKLKGTSTVDFDIQETASGGTPFPVELQYSIDNKNFYSLADFRKVSISGDNILHTDVTGFKNNIRNLFDGSKNLPIYFRTIPSDTKTQNTNYTIDSSLAKTYNLTYDATDKSWHGLVDTSTAKQAISTDEFWNNIPTLTGTSTQNFDVTVPTNISNVSFQFKFENEDASLYKDWATFKADNKDKWTDVTGTTATIKKIVWRAVVSDTSKYIFANTTAKGKSLNLIDANGSFNQQQLGNDKLIAQVPLLARKPAFDGSNTSTMRLHGFDETGMTYEYSTDAGASGVWHTFEEFDKDGAAGQAFRDGLINADGKTLKTITWRVRFDSPFVAAAQQTLSGTFDTSNVKILISSITPLGADIFKGNDSKDWTLDTTKITQIGVKYKIVINGIEYETTDPKLQWRNTINLYNDANNQWVDISWKAEPETGFTFEGQQLKTTGTITPTFKRLVEHITLPTIDGVQSNQYTLREDGHSNVKFQYKSEKVTDWKDSGAFSSAQGNLWNTQADALYNVTFKVSPISTDYLISNSIPGVTNGEGVVSLQIQNNVIGNAPEPKVSGNTTKDYTLDDTIAASHAIYHYWSTQAEKEMTFAEFKIAHPNLWDQEHNRLIEIHYSVKPEAGFNFPAETDKILTTGIGALKKIVEVSKLPTLSVDENCGNTANFTPKGSSATMPNGVDFVYSTSTTGQFDTLATFLQKEKNLYDSTSGTLKTVFYKASISQSNSQDYDFDGTPATNQLTINALPKLIDSFVAPQMIATDNKSNQWSVNAPTTPHVIINYWNTSVTSQKKDIDIQKIGLPTNLFRGKDKLPTIKWEATAESGYIFNSVTTSGDFTNQIDKFIKVYDSDTYIPAPVLDNPSPSNWKSIIEQVPEGLEYKYYLEGETVNDAKSLQDFYSTHTNGIYDSALKKYKDIHFVVSLKPSTPTDKDVYELQNITLDRPITVTNQRTVINNVETPSFDVSATINSHDFTIHEHKNSEVKTTYSIDGVTPLVTNLSYAELIKWINDHHNGNLWDQATDTFLKIKWKVDPANTNADLDPATQFTGTLDYRPAIVAGKMNKYVPIVPPELTGTSTKTSDVTLTKLDTAHFDYRFSRTGTGTGNDGKWVSIDGVWNNFYDAKTGHVKSFFWKATPKAGFATDTTASHGKIIPADTIVKYVDAINEPTLTGTATDNYTITAPSTNGVTITFSTNNTDLNSFEPLSVFTANPQNKNIAGKVVYYRVTLSDTTNYKLDTTKFGQPIAFSTTLDKALDAFTAPTFHASSKSNSWTIDTPDTNVDYKFQVASLNTGWVDAATLLTTVGDKLFDSQTDKMMLLNIKSQLNQVMYLVLIY